MEIRPRLAVVVVLIGLLGASCGATEAQSSSDLEQRVAALEAEVADLQARPDLEECLIALFHMGAFRGAWGKAWRTPSDCK